MNFYSVCPYVIYPFNMKIYIQIINFLYYLICYFTHDNDFFPYFRAFFHNWLSSIQRKLYLRDSRTVSFRIPNLKLNNNLLIYLDDDKYWCYSLWSSHLSDKLKVHTVFEKIVSFLRYFFKNCILAFFQKTFPIWIHEF